MTEIVITIAEKVVGYLGRPIGRQLSYLFCYRSCKDDLNNKVQKLGEARHDVQITVDEATRRGDQIRPIVQEWLDRVDVITGEAEELMKNENKSCFNGWCPNLKSRYRLSREADKKAQVIVQVQEGYNFPNGVSYRIPPRSVSFKNYEPFGSRASILNQIMNALRDTEMKMIGVWGMGGVGKTTMVKQVAEQAKQEMLFTTAVYIDVSWTRDSEKLQEGITKIQKQIADVLGLQFMGEDESTKAAELKQRLQREKILIILDDIWEEVDVREVGIPCKDDQTECNVVLTSRDLHLIRQGIDVENCFQIQQLPLAEAWSLFKKTAGDSMDKPELQHIATEIVKECEGLPVAIVTIAKALKGESVAVWRNALEELRKSAPTNIRGVSKNVYSCLELSYNHLESDEVKSVFLLCGLLGDGDISLDDLLKYGMGLDLFDNINSLEQARNKLVTLVEILKASSLLLDVLEDGCYRRAPPSLIFAEESSRFVRMHDVVRDVAKAIASKDPHRFVVKEALGLQGWQKRDHELENCTRISLNCRDHELPEGLVCPKLGFFLLNSNDNSLKIPDTFFKGMKEVRVLSLFRIDLTQLPSSLVFLSNLRTLCLHQCGTLKDIAILGELKKLQVLSLVGCDIEQFPKEMMQLTDLRMLSLRDCCRILVPRNVISSLSRLEHLLMRNSFYKWESEGVDGGERNACLSELKHLSNLRALEVEIPHSYLLPKDLSFENLTRYDIFIGCRRLWIDDKKTSRRLTLNEVKGSHMVKCFSNLLKTIEVLDLNRFDDTKHFVHELDCDGFLQLKCLYISSSDAMQYIMNTVEMEWDDPTHSAFPLLEQLRLRNLDKLEAICHGPIPMGCFANLRVLVIEACNSLKYILWLPTAQGRESALEFPQLRWLELNDLPNLIEFYSTGTSASGSQEPFSPFFNRQVALPGLEFLHLKSMDNVRTMWHNQHLVGSWCKLKELRLYNCKNLLAVFPSSFVEGLQSLQILEIEYCCSLKEIFEVEEINSAKIDGLGVPPLKELSLHGQNMKSVRNKVPEGYVTFQNLNSLKVGNCTSLKYLFLASMVKGLTQLEVLEISNCGVEEIVANDNGLEAVPMFSFSKLTFLKLTDLDQLKSFYQKKYTLSCPLLKILEVCNCDKVELLFQEKSLHGELDKQPLFLVEKDTFPCVEVMRLGFKGQFSREPFGNLRVLEIIECHDISVAIPSNKLEALHNLEQLILRSCNSVKEVIQVEGHVGETLPQLTQMYLEDLPILTCLSGLGPILQNLRYLLVSTCGNLINLVSLSMAKRLVQLKWLSITTCSMVKEIVGDDGSEATDDISFTKLQKLQLQHLVNMKSFSSARNTFEFPSLEEMEVKQLPRLTHLYKIIPGLGWNLQKLRILEISGCGNLEILLTPSVAKTLVKLEELTVEDCDEVKEIVENEGGEATDDEIVFTKLKKLQLHNLPNLKSFCSARYTFRFPCLTEMLVLGCREMEFFCKGDSITQRLVSVRMGLFSSRWENDLNTAIQKLFMKMHPKEEDFEEEVPDEEDVEEGNSEEKHPKVEDSVKEDTKEEDPEGGLSGSLGQKSS